MMLDRKDVSNKEETTFYRVFIIEFSIHCIVIIIASL